MHLLKKNKIENIRLKNRVEVQEDGGSMSQRDPQSATHMISTYVIVYARATQPCPQMMRRRAIGRAGLTAAHPKWVFGLAWPNKKIQGSKATPATSGSLWMSRTPAGKTWRGSRLS
jgi:hypothetical protein